MDLNLVRVFVAIYEARSLTVAAERLVVTQSAVSQSLARLRHTLGDPLFERAGRGVRPLALADEIYPSFRDALAGIDDALDAAHDFDPATSERTFRIALSELGEIGWLPAIAAQVHTAAPGVRLEVVPLDNAVLEQWLSRGTVDLAVSPADLGDQFRRAPVKTQPYAVVLSTRNPLADGAFDVDRYRLAARVTVASDTGSAMLEAAHRRLGDLRAPQVTIQHVATLPPLLSGSTELVAAIPLLIAEGWAQSWDLAVRDLPFVMPPVDLHLYRRSSTPRAAALDWFHRTVARALADSTGDFAVLEGGRPGPAAPAVGGPRHNG